MIICKVMCPPEERLTDPMRIWLCRATAEIIYEAPRQPIKKIPLEILDTTFEIPPKKTRGPPSRENYFVHSKLKIYSQEDLKALYKKGSPQTLLQNSNDDLGYQPYSGLLYYIFLYWIEHSLYRSYPFCSFALDVLQNCPDLRPIADNLDQTSFSKRLTNENVWKMSLWKCPHGEQLGTKKCPECSENKPPTIEGLKYLDHIKMEINAYRDVPQHEDNLEKIDKILNQNPKIKNLFSWKGHN